MIEGLNISEVCGWAAGILGPAVGYVMVAREKASAARDIALTQMATVLAKMQLFEEQIKDFKLDNRQLAESARVQILDASHMNAGLTKEATANAKLAYKEANDANRKIADLQAKL